MHVLKSPVAWCSELFRWGAMLTVAAMALLIAGAVLMRALSVPLGGEHELIELMMVAVVMLGLAYTQREKGHISIGLLVERLSPRVQTAADLLAVLLLAASCGLIGWANLRMAVEYATVSPMSTDFLSIPLYPFKAVVGLGFWLWGLQALADFADAVGGSSDHDGSTNPGVRA